MIPGRPTAGGPMSLALQAAELGGDAGEVPVGAVIVDSQGVVLATAHNRVEADKDPTAHAEMLAVREATRRRGSPRLPDCDIYVTLEPCPMCAQALAFARIRRIYYAAEDQKGGGVENGARIFAASSCHHKAEVYGGIQEAAAAALLRAFFEKRR